LEAEKSLGGAVRVASRVYPPNGRILAWLEREIAALPIDVRLGVTADFKLLATLGVDRVIDTTKPSRRIPDGAIDGSHLAAVDLTASEVVIVGAGVAGLNLAKFHAEHGARVTVVDTAVKPGRGVALVLRWRLLEDVRAAGVVFYLGASAITVGGAGVNFLDAEGAPREVSAGAVIMADQEKPRTITDAFKDAAAFAAQAAGE
jgi:NADPH-dependent 2,4-dienoyl-CoA reductase/sulfur reductase-like enzyme